MTCKRLITNGDRPLFFRRHGRDGAEDLLRAIAKRRASMQAPSGRAGANDSRPGENRLAVDTDEIRMVPEERRVPVGDARDTTSGNPRHRLDCNRAGEQPSAAPFRRSSSRYVRADRFEPFLVSLLAWSLEAP
jgi:hypothetical protein